MEDQHIEITLGKKTLNCLIAETDEEREIGLSQYKGLDKNEGMIFIYEEPQEAVTYTCEEMSFPIDIIFIDEDAIVISVHHMKAYQKKTVSEEDVQFVVETNINSGIKIGDRLDGDLWEEEDFSEDEKSEVSSHGKMLILDENGDVQMKLVGGERIVSRIKTRQLIKAAIKAYHSDEDSDYRRVGKLIISELIAQDNRDPQYVEAPSKHQEGGQVTAFTQAQLNNMKRYWNILKQKGYSDRNAAAILGNLFQESSFDHTKVSNKGAKGVAQLLGDELTYYNNYLTSNNLKDSDDTMVGYIADMISGIIPHKWSQDFDRMYSAYNTLAAKKKREAWEEKEMKDYYDKMFSYKGVKKVGTDYPSRHIKFLQEAMKDDSKSIDDIVSSYSYIIEKPNPKEEMLSNRIKYANDIYNLMHQ